LPGEQAFPATAELFSKTGKDRTMNAHVMDGSFGTRFKVAKTPAEVFAAINDVRGWWGGKIEGESERVGARFS
jgi:hypothetical protein